MLPGVNSFISVGHKGDRRASAFNPILNDRVHYVPQLPRVRGGIRPNSALRRRQALDCTSSTYRRIVHGSTRKHKINLPQHDMHFIVICCTRPTQSPMPPPILLNHTADSLNENLAPMRRCCSRPRPGNPVKCCVFGIGLGPRLCLALAARLRSMSMKPLALATPCRFTAGRAAAARLCWAAVVCCSRLSWPTSGRPNCATLTLRIDGFSAGLNARFAVLPRLIWRGSAIWQLREGKCPAMPNSARPATCSIMARCFTISISA